jgi:hypothetical protein
MKLKSRSYSSDKNTSGKNYSSNLNYVSHSYFRKQYKYNLIRFPFFLVFYIYFILCRISLAATLESPSSSSSDYYDYINQRRSTVSPSKNTQKNTQMTSKLTAKKSQAISTTSARNRSNQGQNLKKLLQELEESDYSNYGSWGNFRQRPPAGAGTVGASLSLSLSFSFSFSLSFSLSTTSRCRNS